MNRKEKIDSVIKELDEKYRPEEKFKGDLTPIVAKLYDASFPESEIDRMLDIVRSAYQNHCETRTNISQAKEDLSQIARDFGELGRQY